MCSQVQSVGKLCACMRMQPLAACQCSLSIRTAATARESRRDPRTALRELRLWLSIDRDDTCKEISAWRAELTAWPCLAAQEVASYNSIAAGYRYARSTCSARARAVKCSVVDISRNNRYRYPGTRVHRIIHTSIDIQDMA